MIQFAQVQAAFNAATSITQVAKLMEEVRDRLEIMQTSVSDFANFLNYMFPILRDLIVTKISPQFEDNEENRVRHCLLEIFNKFPNNEALKPYVYEIMVLSLKVLAEDNEDNAIIALKIIFDLHKAFRASLEQYNIIPFLETVSRIYNNMPAAIYALAPALTEQAPSSSLDATSTTTLVKSVESFKVLTECPIILMLILQWYPRFVSKTMNQMVPVMLTMLSLIPTVTLDTAPQRPQRQRYREFLAAEVRFVSAVSKNGQYLIILIICSLMAQVPSIFSSF
jgi:transformation/transcription domain-associated protein